MSLNAFTTSPLLQNLNPSQQQSLFDAGDMVRHASDEIVVSEGENLDRLFIILKGGVQIFLPKIQSRYAEVILSNLDVGHCFGEYTFLDDKPASASVRCRGDSAFFVINQGALQDYLNRHSDAGCIVYRNLLAMLVERLRKNNNELDLFQPVNR